MATCAALTAADEALRTSEERANFDRLVRLLMRGGLVLLRETFDSIHPPASLPTVLSNPTIKAQLQSLRRKKVLTQPEWDCLYVSKGKSADFDISLLFKLLRNICSLTCPATGWDSLPNISDHSLEADLARIKFYRNTVYGHNLRMEITDADFDYLWSEISEALLRIAGSISTAKQDEWKKASESLLNDELTPDAKQYVLELQQWYKKDMDTKDEIEKMNIKLEQLNIMLEQLTTKQDQHQTNVLQVIKILTIVESVLPRGSSIELSQLLSTSQPQEAETAPPHTETEREADTYSGQWEPQQNQLTDIDIWRVILSFKSSFSLLIDYLRKLGVQVINSMLGSLVISVSCSSSKVLEELWEDFCSGHLSEVVQETLITAEVLKVLCFSEIKLTTIISEEEYKACKKFLTHSQASERTYVKHSEIPEGADYTTASVYVMVINNYYFPEKQRFHQETLRLQLRLQDLFDFKFGFRSTKYDNLTKSEMLNELMHTAEKDFSEYDCFVCVILSDGSKDGIFGSDDEMINPETITSLFTRDKCPSLDGKPKIFLSETFYRSQTGEGPPPRPVISEDDFLIWYAPLFSEPHVYFETPLFFVAYSLERPSSKKHLMDILMRANEEAESELPYRALYLVSTLTKNVFFISK